MNQELSPFPWTLSLCLGEALQFLITDSQGSIVLMGEMYSEQDFLSLITILQRTPEIKVNPDTEELLKERRERRPGFTESILSGLKKEKRDSIGRS